jgi:hypothetical protein
MLNCEKDCQVCGKEEDKFDQGSMSIVIVRKSSGVFPGLWQYWTVDGKMLWTVGNRD